MASSELAYSENIEMYLVNILREQHGEQALPLPELAELLGISTASVNEMIKKLDEGGFVHYIPYTGVELTPQGVKVASEILRMHRLWEVFLVEKLGFGPESAHDIACRLEHATPHQLAERLNEFLDFPTVNPNGEPIPKPEGEWELAEERHLDQLAPGEGGTVVDITGQAPERDYLHQVGVRRGSPISVLAVDPTSMFVQVEDRKVALARTLARVIVLDTEELKQADELTRQNDERMNELN